MATLFLLGFLAELDALMDRRLSQGRMEGFNPWHQAYLIVSTGQWFVNLGLLDLSLRLWEEE